METIRNKKFRSTKATIKHKFQAILITCTVAVMVILLSNSVDSKVLKKQWVSYDKSSGNPDHRKLLDYFDEYYEDSHEDTNNLNLNTNQQQQHFSPELFDEDVESRYITEDDVEESYNYDSEDAHHPGPKIMHLDPRCPDLPQPSKLSENFCKAKSCLNDDDCRHFENAGSKFPPKSTTFKGRSIPPPSYICCFNGCLHTCLPKVEPPIAFDWLEETDVKRDHYNETTGFHFTPGGGSPATSSDLNPKALDSKEDADGKIVLPGGCFITPKQLQELRLFRKFEHVETCTCLNGEVVCQINPRISFHPDELQGSKLPI